MAHVVLAAPDHLHRRFHRHRDLGCLECVIHAEPPPESTAAHRHVDRDRLGRLLDQRGDALADPVRRLRRRPDVGSIGADVGRAVHRLERRVRLKRILVGRLDRSCCGDGSTRRDSVPAGDDSGRARRLLELPSKRFAVERCVRSVVPRDVERFAPLERGPRAVGDDGDSGRDPRRNRDHGAHARRRHRPLVVPLHDLPADHRRPQDRRELHAWNPHVEAEGRRPGHDWPTVDSRTARADDRVVLRVLERRIRRDGKLRGRLGQLAVPEPPIRRHVHDRALLGPACRAVDAPRSGGGRDEHLSRCGAGRPKRSPVAADGPASTRPE